MFQTSNFKFWEAKQEAKQVLNQKYGTYCNWCREMNLDIKPFYSFTLAEYEIVRELRKKKWPHRLMV